MNTKEKILNASVRLFAEKGFDAVGVAEIAAAVGIKAPSLYKHYKSKRDIFDNIIERVNEADSQNANRYDMPVDSAENNQEIYLNLSVENMKAFTHAMFLHWTKEEFFCNFRKILTLEQFKDKTMNKLYNQYISKGPTEYMADIFFGFTSSKDTANMLAVEYYGPMYLMYSLYDAGVEQGLLTDMLDKHIENFCDKLKGLKKVN